MAEFNDGMAETRPPQAATVTTDVLIVGSGPAGASAALLLSTLGVDNIMVTKYRWTANTPRAHITNQRSMEIFRDMGIEDQVLADATEHALVGDTVFCTAIAGEEIGRIHTWGTRPDREGDYQLASPCLTVDIPQTYLEPILVRNATMRGTQARFSTEYLAHRQDADGVDVDVLDRLSGHRLHHPRQVRDRRRRRPLQGRRRHRTAVRRGDGHRRIDEHHLQGRYRRLCRPSPVGSVLGAAAGLQRRRDRGRPGAHGAAVGRVARSCGATTSTTSRPRSTTPRRRRSSATCWACPTWTSRSPAASLWGNNEMYATHLQRGRVFCAGDAIHRHPPSNGLGSNTSVQDSYNLAWKLAAVLNGQAAPALLDTYSAERAPVAERIVKRANKSSREFVRVVRGAGRARRDHRGGDGGRHRGAQGQHARRVPPSAPHWSRRWI